MSNAELIQLAERRVDAFVASAARIGSEGREPTPEEANVKRLARCVETLLAHRQKLLNVAHAAEALDSYLTANVGNTKDWPLRIVWDDKVVADCFDQLWTALKEALKK